MMLRYSIYRCNFSCYVPHYNPPNGKAIHISESRIKDWLDCGNSAETEVLGRYEKLEDALTEWENYKTFCDTSRDSSSSDYICVSVIRIVEEDWEEEDVIQELREIDFSAEEYEEGTQFIKVISENRTFYDLVKHDDAEEHLRRLLDEGYSANLVDCVNVPPCVYRDFYYDIDRYFEGVWKQGKDFYIDVK